MTAPSSPAPSLKRAEPERFYGLTRNEWLLLFGSRLDETEFRQLEVLVDAAFSTLRVAPPEAEAEELAGWRKRAEAAEALLEQRRAESNPYYHSAAPPLAEEGRENLQSFLSNLNAQGGSEMDRATPVEPPLILDHEFVACPDASDHCMDFGKGFCHAPGCAQSHSRHRSAQGGEERG